MGHTTDQRRYVYCKNGDVVAQLAAIGDCPKAVPDGGPDTYTANFLQFACGGPVLLLSYCDRDAISVSGNVVAHTFKKSYPYKWMRILAWLKIFINTLFCLFRFRPTHILCATSGSPLWACFLVSRINGIPLILTRHARFWEENKSTVKSLIEKIDAVVVRRASSVICHGPYLREHMLALGVNPNKLHEFNISYRYLLAHSHDVLSSEIPDISEHGKYRCILFVGTMTREKGIFDLFVATKNLLRTHSNLRLIFAGKGPDLLTLKDNVKNSNLENQIFILGHVNHELLPLLILQSAVVVTPTRSTYPESRCKSAIEGIVLGKPVIAPNFGPFPYVLRHEHNGLLYQADSVSDLKDKVSAVISDSVLYSRLLQGAKEEGAKLLDSPLSFRRALEMVYM